MSSDDPSSIPEKTQATQPQPRPLPPPPSRDSAPARVPLPTVAADTKTQDTFDLVPSRQFIKSMPSHKVELLAVMVADGTPIKELARVTGFSQPQLTHFLDSPTEVFTLKVEAYRYKTQGGAWRAKQFAILHEAAAQQVKLDILTSDACKDWNLKYKVSKDLLSYLDDITPLDQLQAKGNDSAAPGVQANFFNNNQVVAAFSETLQSLTEQALVADRAALPPVEDCLDNPNVRLGTADAVFDTTTTEESLDLGKVDDRLDAQERRALEGTPDREA